QATARWRIERDVAHSLSQTIFRQIEILKRAAHEDACSVDGFRRRALAVCQTDAHAFLRQKSCALQSSQSRADNHHVEMFHTIHSRAVCICVYPWFRGRLCPSVLSAM